MDYILIILLTPPAIFVFWSLYNVILDIKESKSKMKKLELNEKQKI